MCSPKFSAALLVGFEKYFKSKIGTDPLCSFNLFVTLLINNIVY